MQIHNAVSWTLSSSTSNDNVNNYNNNGDVGPPALEVKISSGDLRNAQLATDPAWK